MLITALWVLEQEFAWAKKHFTYTDPHPDEMGWYEAAATLALIGGATVQSSAITMMPYYGLYKAHSAASWAVRDTLWTRSVKRTGAFGGKYNTYTLFNMFPRVGRFAQRGGIRFAATKVASRFIPYVGWGLFAYDLWNVGKWIGEKTSPR